MCYFYNGYNGCRCTIFRSYIEVARYMKTQMHSHIKCKNWTTTEKKEGFDEVQCRKIVLQPEEGWLNDAITMYYNGDKFHWVPNNQL